MGWSGGRENGIEWWRRKQAHGFVRRPNRYGCRSGHSLAGEQRLRQSEGVAKAEVTAARARPRQGLWERAVWVTAKTTQKALQAKAETEGEEVAHGAKAVPEKSEVAQGAKAEP